MDWKSSCELVSALSAVATAGATVWLVTVGLGQIKALKNQIGVTHEAAKEQIAAAREAVREQINAAREAVREQIKVARDENRLERTLNACSRYEADAVIERCVKELKKAYNSGEYEQNPPEYEHQVTMVLNYLDTIAIGIEQQLYVEELARDHMEPIVRYYYERYMDPSQAMRRNIDLNAYHSLMKLAHSWFGSQVKFRAEDVRAPMVAI